jgi:hypothetical protein
MSESPLDAIRERLGRCTAEEQGVIFRELRKLHAIHEFEAIIGAPAEMILEAVHRAPELTRRMLRGVIADAAFRTFTVASLRPHGWNDVTPAGNFAYDYKLDDGAGLVTVQVKLQRSERGAPVVRSGERYSFGPEVFMTETQKTRTGTDGEDKQTRPYRYGEFDVLAVSMQPSSGRWDGFMYTLGRWLLPGKKPGEIATLQPVAKTPNDFWTDDFRIAASWLRSEEGRKRMKDKTPAKKRVAAKRKGGTTLGRKRKSVSDA